MDLYVCAEVHGDCDESKEGFASPLKRFMILSRMMFFRILTKIYGWLFVTDGFPSGIRLSGPSSEINYRILLLLVRHFTHVKKRTKCSPAEQKKTNFSSLWTNGSTSIPPSGELSAEGSKRLLYNSFNRDFCL